MAVHQDKDTESGFRPFWEKLKKDAAFQNVTFVSVEPSGASKISNKKSKSKKPIANAKKSQSKPADGAPDASRRQQVYQAQKRHRQRKTEYSKTLEADKTRLRHQQALIDHQSQQLDQENAVMRELLASHGLADEIDRPSSDQRPNRRPSNHSSRAGITCSSPEESSLATPMSPDSLADRPKQRKDSLALGLHLDESRSKGVRSLLLRDVKGYESGEEVEEQTWKAIAEMVLSDAQPDR